MSINTLRQRCRTLDETIAALQSLRAATRDYAVTIHQAQSQTAELDGVLSTELQANAEFIQEVLEQREHLSAERAKSKAKAKQKAEAKRRAREESNPPTASDSSRPRTGDTPDSGSAGEAASGSTSTAVPRGRTRTRSSSDSSD